MHESNQSSADGLGRASSPNPAIEFKNLRLSKSKESIIKSQMFQSVSCINKQIAIHLKQPVGHCRWWRHQNLSYAHSNKQVKVIKKQKLETKFTWKQDF